MSVFILFRHLRAHVTARGGGEHTFISMYLIKIFGDSGGTRRL